MTEQDWSERQYSRALLVFTAATGAVDGVSFIALDKVFTGNMTGNVLFIGFGLVGVENIPVLNNLTALFCFLLGAALGARITRSPAADARIPLASLLVTAVNTGVTLLLAVCWLVIGTLEPPLMLIVTGILALLLGAQAAAVRRAGLRDLTTVVLTMTMVSLSSDSRLAGGSGPAWLRRIAAIVAMGAGALISAALAVHAGGAEALLAAGALMAIGVITLGYARRAELHRSPTGAQDRQADDGS